MVLVISLFGLRETGTSVTAERGLQRIFESTQVEPASQLRDLG